MNIIGSNPYIPIPIPIPGFIPEDVNRTHQAIGLHKSAPNEHQSAPNEHKSAPNEHQSAPNEHGHEIGARYTVRWGIGIGPGTAREMAKHSLR